MGIDFLPDKRLELDDVRSILGDVTSVLGVEHDPGDGFFHAIVGERHDRLVYFVGIAGDLAQFIGDVAVGDVAVGADGKL